MYLLLLRNEVRYVHHGRRRAGEHLLRPAGDRVRLVRGVSGRQVGSQTSRPLRGAAGDEKLQGGGQPGEGPGGVCRMSDW